MTAQTTRPSIAAEVRKELEEMRKIGIRVSRAALAYPEANAAEMQEMRDGCMSIGEIADYVAQVSK